MCIVSIRSIDFEIYIFRINLCHKQNNNNYIYYHNKYNYYYFSIIIIMIFGYYYLSCDLSLFIFSCLIMYNILYIRVMVIVPLEGVLLPLLLPLQCNIV